MSLKRIATLMLKDINDAIRTPRLLIIVVTPFIIALAIQMFFSNKLTLRLGIYSPDFTQMIAILKQIELVEVTQFGTADDLKTAVTNKDIVIGVILPPDFDMLLGNNKFPHVEIFLADYSPEGQMGISILQQAFILLAPNSLPVKISTTILQPEVTQGISLRGNLSIDKYAIVLWLVMGIVGNGVMLVPTLIVEERERKTLDALLLSPVSYFDIVAAKALVGALYSFVSSGLIISIQGAFYSVSFPMIVLILLGGFSLSLLGVLIGDLSENLHVLNSYGSLFVFLLVLPALVGMLGPHPLIQYLQGLPTFPLTQGITHLLGGNNEGITRNILLLFFQTIILLGAVVFNLRRHQARS